MDEFKTESVESIAKDITITVFNKFTYSHGAVAAAQVAAEIYDTIHKQVVESMKNNK
jgi:hypothetical protein